MNRLGTMAGTGESPFGRIGRPPWGRGWRQVLTALFTKPPVEPFSALPGTIPEKP